MESREAKLERHVDLLRQVVREMLPVVDWANLNAGAYDHNMEEYIHQLRPKVSAALDETVPMKNQEKEVTGWGG